MQSLDDLSESIYHSRSKEIFQEALLSFHAGAFRSSVTMAWTAVVGDLYFKLIELHEIHGDPTANAIILKISASQQKGQNKAEWESLILDEIESRTPFFEHGEHKSLLRLRDVRHLSAHPVINSSTLEFYQPSRDEARALLRTALTTTLTKNPLLSRKVVSSFVEDLAAVKDKLVSLEDCIQYVHAKWLPNMPRPTLITVFKALWGFCFRLNTEEARVNRKVNRRALVALIRHDRSTCIQAMREDAVNYSNISDETGCINSLHLFLGLEPDFYPGLRENATTILKNFVAESAGRQSLSWYQHPTIEDHLIELKIFVIDLMENNPTKLRNTLEADSWAILIKKCNGVNEKPILCSLATILIKMARSFDSADWAAERIIEAIDIFENEELLELVAAIEGNSQAYGRGKAHTLRAVIIEQATALNLKLEEDDYPMFWTG